MKFRLLLLFALVSLPVISLRAEQEETRREKPSLIGRFRGLFHRGNDASDEPKKSAGARQLAVGMTLDPLPLRLGETRLLKVSLTLTNRSKQLVQLAFPTSQRIEVLMRDARGKLVEQWSEDQSFASEPTTVSVNPRERLEYTVSVATRDMRAGEPFTIEAFLPNHESLRAQKTITPEK